MEQFALDFAPSRRVFTVGELNDAIAGLLSREFQIVLVAGEISGVKTLASGHSYFTLKDADAQIRCALFKGTARFLTFKPKDGIAVVARGRLDVFPVRGEYQLIVDHLEPQGHGALQLAFEQMKKKLAEEGLFDRERKRALPPYPRRIGIVTSPRGAVISDILRVLERRFPGMNIRLFPVIVQGEGAADEIVRALQFFSRSEWAEVVILARGGGSLEDLWTFNEERVARAIASSKPPVISAIGHETDFTIADFVADLRAPTPSAAAELVICTRHELLERLGAVDGRVLQNLRYRVATLHRRVEQQAVGRSEAVLHRTLNRRAQSVDELDGRLWDLFRRKLQALQSRRFQLTDRLRMRDVRPKLARDRAAAERSHAQLQQVVTAAIVRRRARFEKALARLEQLSPLRVLERGYAIVSEKEKGWILKDPAQVKSGTALEVRVARGRFEAEAR